MGASGDLSGRWYCGPPANRRAYIVTDIHGISGGQGIVRRAERSTFSGDPVGYTGRVSLKLFADLTPERVELLRARWDVLAQVRHPNVAQALELFEGPGLFVDSPPHEPSDDVVYTATAWVEGVPLPIVARVPAERAFAMARGMAAGIKALHDAGLVHRDQHPGNVIIQPDDSPVLIDFGSVRPDVGGTTGTVSGVIGFMAPDQLTGPGGVAADLWGLGMLTIYALLGHPQGTTALDRLRRELRTALRPIGDPQRATDLLCRMVDPEPKKRPSDPVRWAQDLVDCLTPPPAHRRRWPLVASAVAVTVAAVGFVGWRSVHHDDSQVETPKPKPCPSQPATPLGPESELADAVAELIEDDCVDGRIDTYQKALVQRLKTREGKPAGVVLLSPSKKAVRLTQPMWTSYKTIAGSTVNYASAIFGGYPTRVEYQDHPDAVIVHLDKSGILVGPRDDTLMFWIPEQVVDLWYQRGGPDGDLGFPTSNVYFDGELHLDFEHGSMDAPAEDEIALAHIIAGGDVDATVHLHDGRSALGNLDRLPGRIVRQENGTAWWVDDRKRRHWIPDGGVWTCLGGDKAVIRNYVKGWAIGPLPIGDPATCGDRFPL